MAKLLDGYRPIKDIEPFTVDDEKDAFVNNSAINNAERWRSHYFINSILIVLLVMLVTFNVAINIRLQRQMALTVEASRSRFGKI